VGDVLLWKAKTSEYEILCPGVINDKVGNRWITESDNLCPAISTMIFWNSEGAINPSLSVSKYLKA
jgi:hypothetical protein